MGIRASYLINPASGTGPADPHEKVPELSRRARGIPVWAALRSLGRDGVASLVDGLAANARAIATGIAWMSGSRWRGRSVLRVSVSNWSTDAADVSASIEAVRRAAASV